MKYFFVFFLGFFHSAFSQKGYVIGKVMDKQRQVPIELAMVQNLRTKASTKTDAKGNFFILTQARDTLEIYAMGFKKSYLGVSKTIKDTTVYLKEDARQLQEVVIKGKREGVLQREIDDFNDEPTASLKLEAGEIFSSLMSPSGIYDLLSGNLKNAHRAAVARQDYIRQHLVRLRYSKALAQHITKLPNEELERFMQYCNVPDEMILRYSDYDLHHEILRCLDAYKKR